MSASAYSLTATLPAEGFEIISGAPVIGGMHGAEAHHHHCPHCLSWVFTLAPALPEFVNLRATMLDETEWFAPFVEMYVIEKLPFAGTGARHAYDRFPPVEDYMTLAAAYAANQNS